MGYCNCYEHIIARTIDKYIVLRNGTKYRVEKVRYFCSECGKTDSVQEYETEM